MKVLPIFCLDPRQFKLSLLDSTNQGYGELKISLKSALDLKKNLRYTKSVLLVSVGYTEDAISRTKLQNLLMWYTQKWLDRILVS